MGRSAKQTVAAAERNRRPILEVLRRILPDTGRILEIASGTGQHVVAFAEAYPELNWCPSDPDPSARASIAAWVQDSGGGNVAAPTNIDVTEPGWFVMAVPDERGVSDVRTALEVLKQTIKCN